VTTEHAKYLSESLRDVAASYENRDIDLDGILRILDLGDRLHRMGGANPQSALVQESRAEVVAQIHAFIPEGYEWPPMDAIGDAILPGESDRTLAWGMSLLRIANVLLDLEPEPRRGATRLIHRALTRLLLDPRAFPNLASLAAQRVEFEPLDQ
jgi:hypothetical protein